MMKIQEALASEVAESLHLEFKRSDLLIQKKINEICKAASALANSDGGTLIFGIIESKASGQFSLDGGVSDIDRVVEWLDAILQGNISPRLHDFEILRETIDGRHYISVRVGRSSSAPHQSSDYCYYRRSNSRSIPMEAYEIDDIRMRRLSSVSPLVISIEVAPNTLTRLVIFNRSQYICYGLTLDVVSNFDLRPFQNKKEGKIALSRIGIGQRIEYTLGTAHGILSEVEDARLEVQGTYKSEFSNQAISVSDNISLGELVGTALPQDELTAQVKKVSEEIKNLKTEIARLAEPLSEIATTMGGSGVRISPLSIFQSKAGTPPKAFSEFKYSIYSLTVDGVAEVLETTVDVVSEFHDSFRWRDRKTLDEKLKELPAEVAQRARERLSFDRR